VVARGAATVNGSRSAPCGGLIRPGSAWPARPCLTALIGPPLRRTPWCAHPTALNTDLVMRIVAVASAGHHLPSRCGSIAAHQGSLRWRGSLGRRLSTPSPPPMVLRPEGLGLWPLSEPNPPSAYRPRGDAAAWPMKRAPDARWWPDHVHQMSARFETTSSPPLDAGCAARLN